MPNNILRPNAPRIVKARDTYTLDVEWLLGLTSTSYGIYCLWPGVDVYGTSPALLVLAALSWLPQWLFGCGFLFLGLLRIWSALRGSNLERAFVASMGVFEWGVIYYLVSIYNRDHHILSPNIILFSLPSSMSSWVAGYLIWKMFRRHFAKRREV